MEGNMHQTYHVRLPHSETPIALQLTNRQVGELLTRLFQLDGDGNGSRDRLDMAPAGSRTQHAPIAFDADGLVRLSDGTTLDLRGPADPDQPMTEAEADDVLRRAGIADDDGREHDAIVDRQFRLAGLK